MNNEHFLECITEFLSSLDNNWLKNSASSIYDRFKLDNCLCGNPPEVEDLPNKYCFRINCYKCDCETGYVSFSDFSDFLRLRDSKINAWKSALIRARKEKALSELKSIGVKVKVVDE